LPFSADCRTLEAVFDEPTTILLIKEATYEITQSMILLAGLLGVARVIIVRRNPLLCWLPQLIIIQMLSTRLP